MDAPAPLLIFTHIPKAAGSTLAAVLRGQYARDEILDVTPLSGAEREERVAHLPAQVKLIIGHARFGLHRHTDRPCRYFTILREPVERVISAYYYIHRTPEHPLSAKVGPGDEGLKSLAKLQLNIQTKYVAGTPAEAEADEAELERAKKNLEEAYAAVGVAEAFDESLLLFMETFGWRTAPYTRRNVTRDRPPSAAHGPEALAMVRETNQLDTQLHAFAAGMLRARIAAQPPGFQERLRKYRRRLGWTAWRQAMRARLTALLRH